MALNPGAGSPILMARADVNRASTTPTRSIEYRDFVIFTSNFAQQHSIPICCFGSRLPSTVANPPSRLESDLRACIAAQRLTIMHRNYQQNVIVITIIGQHGRPLQPLPPPPLDLAGAQSRRKLHREDRRLARVAWIGPLNMT